MNEPRKEVLSDSVMLWLGDCRDVLPLIKRVDAVVTDPPYGIGADAAASKNRGKWGWKYYGDTNWDHIKPTPEMFFLILAAAPIQIIWGGNYFTDVLPPSMQWLMWDKGQRDFSLADFEMAWSSQNKAARAFTYSRSLALRDGKEHPTQKPLEVMACSVWTNFPKTPCRSLTRSWDREPQGGSNGKSRIFFLGHRAVSPNTSTYFCAAAYPRRYLVLACPSMSRSSQSKRAYSHDRVLAR